MGYRSDHAPIQMRYGTDAVAARLLFVSGVAIANQCAPPSACPSFAPTILMSFTTSVDLLFGLPDGPPFRLKYTLDLNIKRS